MHYYEQRTSAVLFFVLFIDLLGFSFVMPQIAPLFTDISYGILSTDTSLATRHILLGFLLAVYPLAQFFGAPLMGSLSDRYGRKPLLIISLFSNSVAYFLDIYAINSNHIGIFFVAHLIAGFTGATISLTQSALADVSNSRVKPQRFGLIMLALGIGTIIAPLIGGQLVNGITPFYALPFWCAAFLSVFNIFIALLAFKETLSIPQYDVPINPLSGIRHLFDAFKMPALKTMFIVAFFFSFGWNCFIKFFQVFLVDTYDISAIGIGKGFAYFGFWMIISQALIIRPLAKRWAPRQTLISAAFLLACAIPLLVISHSISIFFALFPVIVVSQGLIYPNTIAVISDNAPLDMQGKILGITQSIQSLAKGIAPTLSGILAAQSTSFPLLTASILIFIGIGIYTVTNSRSAYIQSEMN